MIYFKLLDLSIWAVFSSVDHGLIRLSRTLRNQRENLDEVPTRSLRGFSAANSGLIDLQLGHRWASWKGRQICVAHIAQILDADLTGKESIRSEIAQK